jgi:hypothetical protein
MLDSQYIPLRIAPNDGWATCNIDRKERTDTMRAFAKPPVAIGFAAFFFCGLLCTHLDEVTAAPLGLAGDFLAGVALLVGGILSGRDWAQGRQYQVVGWSFMASLLFHSVLGNLSDVLTHATDAGTTGIVTLSPVAYTAIEAAFLVLSFAGLWTTLKTSEVVSV